MIILSIIIKIIYYYLVNITYNFSSLSSRPKLSGIALIALLPKLLLKIIKLFY